MQHSAHTGSGRRQDRVPLAVGIDLRGIDLHRAASQHGDRGDRPEPLEPEGAHVTLAADGLNVSIGGIAMRSSYVPPLGALLECTFQCPPGGETVCAQGEVIWAERSGPDEGEFGMRFVELDTKSATALRRYVLPIKNEQQKPERLRAATLVIDGLGNTVEAELKLADDSRIVLEQQLSFLQLGRGVEVSVPGRGKERGRIASVELRHTHFDVPTLVFGVLLDEAPERQAELVPTHVAPLFSTPFSTVMRPELPVSAQASARMRESGAQLEQRGRERFAALPDERTPALPGDVLNDMLSRVPRESRIPREPMQVELLGVAPPGEPLEPADHDEAEEEPQLLVSAADSAPALCVDDAELHASHADDACEDDGSEDDGSADYADDADDADGEDADDAEVAPGEGRAGAHDSPMALRVRSLPAHLRALFRAQGVRLQGLRQRIEPTLREQAEFFDLPDAKTRILMQLARLRALLLQSWSKVRRSTARTGPRSARTLRVQRSTLLGLGPADTERSEPSKLTRGVAIAFAVLGVGLGVYALAPRSGADRIKLPERVDQQAEALGSEPVLAAGKDELDFGDDDLELVPEPRRVPDKRSAKAGKALAGAEAEAAIDSTPALSAPFGQADVPNGRVFTLRMNGPVQLVEGEARDNGFTVRVPGRLAVDKASPIATSHDAVQRAMILNRGGYAELTVDFISGKSPRYQVRGKDNTLEVTLERL